MSKMMIIPNPYAGLSGTGNTVQLRSLEDRVIIRLVPVQYFLMIFVLVAFGSLLVLIALAGSPTAAADGFITGCSMAAGRLPRCLRSS